MKIAGIDFPKPLIDALYDDELVIFAGAGVSMGEPACLPNFEHLAKMIAEGTGKTLRAGEEIDHFLGRLEHGGVKVHERAAEILSRDGLETTELHRNLLRLYPDVGKIRIVTTNFDRLFEQAATDIFGSVPEIFRASALPTGGEFHGIVHIHGSTDYLDEMVITVKDFGRAYMAEIRAAPFLVELFSNFKILFIGYSYGDAIMNYLTEALTEREEGRRFALIGKNNNDTDRWHRLGIEPIAYPQSSEGDHSKLDEGIRRLAEFIQWSAVDWHREITEIAENPPSLDEETEDLIRYALEDDTRTRFFTEAATSPEWIDWLDKRGYLNALFDNGGFSEQAEIFSRWLVEQFAYTHANTLFLLIGKHNMCLPPRFWYNLAYQIGWNQQILWNKDILSRWISLLLATVQENVNASLVGHIHPSALLQWLGERCIQHEILDGLLQVFDAMMENYLQLKPGFSWSSDDENDEELPVNAELLLIGKHDGLSKLWKEGLQPELSQVAEPLLSRVIRRLEDRYITLCTWQQINYERDSDSRRRSAIEPHEQDRYPRSVDVLIDAARDCLEWLTLNQVDIAAQWCNRLVSSDAPLLRRLAVHGLFKRENLTVDEKIDWLLKHVDLHERSIHHEVFRAVGLAYHEISSERKEVLIESVRNYPWAEGDDPETRRYIARRHFNWFDWLHQSEPNCALAQQARNEVLADYPNFEPTEHPDLTYWMTSDWGGLQSPLTPEQLLANPASHWLGNLLSFQSTEWEETDRIELINNVTEAARQDFDWSLDLADALGEIEEWEVYPWSALIHAWSTMELNEDKHRKVLYWLGKTELYTKHNREIAKVLYTLVRHDGPSYASDLLPQANKIAASLWHHLDQIDRSEEIDDWFKFAANYPAWDLANFWLYGLSLWRKQQDPRPTILSGEYREALSDIVEDQSLSGKLGRTVLASQFAFLLAVDETWTLDNLLPLFAPDNADFQAAWDGFVNRGHLNPAVVDVMAAAFLKAVERINNELFNQRYRLIHQRDRFIKYYIGMFGYLDENPLERWIPKFFQYASQGMPSVTEAPTFFPRSIPETKDLFAVEVGSRLRKMTETEQQEWWERWLKRYWENRLDGIPDELEAGEIAQMLNWLPHLTTIFPEAVDLAVRMPQESLQNCRVIDKFSINDENELWQRHPESVAKLLIYLRECGLPRHSWYSAQDLIDNLLSVDISEQLREELEEIKVQLL